MQLITTLEVINNNIFDITITDRTIEINTKANPNFNIKKSNVYLGKQWKT